MLAEHNFFPGAIIFVWCCWHLVTTSNEKCTTCCPPHHQSREMKERVWKWTFHVCLLNALRTLKFLLEVCVPQTLLYENYRCFTMEQNPLKKLRKRRHSRLFCYSDTTFSCSLLHTTTCANFEAIHHVPHRGAAMYGGAQFLAPSLAGFFYRCTTRRYCFLRSTRDSMFVTLIAFLLRAHVNSLLSTQSWLIIILRNANIFGKYSLE